MSASTPAPALADTEPAAPDFARHYWRSTPASNVAAELSAATVGDADFRMLADNIPTLCWIARGDGYIVWYNRRWHEYHGTTPEQMEGWGWQAVHDPAHLPSVMARWTDAIETGQPFEMTFPLRGADGVFRPFLTRIQPLRDGRGHIVRWFGVNTDISDQAEAEAALRRERDRSRDVLENMAEGFALMDRDFRLIDINAEGLRLDGRDAAQIVGLTHWEAWPGSEHSELGRAYERAMAERAHVTLEHCYAWPDRRSAWVEMRAFPSGDGLAVFFRDVTERRAAQAQIEASEARFRTVAEAMPGFVWTADASGALDYTSPSWHAYCGADQAGSSEAGWADFIHPDDREQGLGRWVAAIAAATPYEAEFRLRRADGQYRWWLARALPTLGEDGAVAGWVGVCTDLDDMIAAREGLARSRLQLATIAAERTQERDQIWRLIPDLLMTGSLDGRILSLNRAWSDVLGHSEQALLERPFWDIIHPEQLPQSAEAIAAMAEGRTTRHQNRLRTAAGDYRWFDWVSTPDGRNFYAVARDITEEKAREAALEQAREALRQSQKMEAVGQLTGGIAHDFNNMLAVVIGSLDLLGRRMPTQDARARRYVDAATEAARRAALLTQRLLAFSRQQPLKPERTDAGRLVADMAELLRHSLGADILLDTEAAADLWCTDVDQNQLENVIVNLAVNARDAMQQGGRLSIETGNRLVSPRDAAATPGLEPGEHVLIVVTDTGTGMPADIVARAFDPFFTTKEVGRGTGLGLSQVYGFVRQSGGHVRIRSTPGQGTAVEIYLPRAEDGECPVEARAAASPDVRPSERAELILVVEDEPAVRQLSLDALSELGYRVLAAEDAVRAMTLLAEHSDIGLLFTDIVMPGTSGVRLAEQARLGRPDLKVLFTTGYTRDAVAHNHTLDPGMELLAKPFTLEQLAAKLRHVLDAAG